MNNKSVRPHIDGIKYHVICYVRCSKPTDELNGETAAPIQSSTFVDSISPLLRANTNSANGQAGGNVDQTSK